MFNKSETKNRKGRTSRTSFDHLQAVFLSLFKRETPNIYFRNVLIFFLKSVQANSAVKKYLPLPHFLVFVFFPYLLNVSDGKINVDIRLK